MLNWMGWLYIPCLQHFFFSFFKYIPLLWLLSIYFSCCGLVLLTPGKHMILRVATPFLKTCSSSSLFSPVDLCSWLCLLKCCALQFSLLNYMLFLRSLPIFAHITLHSSPVLQCAYNPLLPAVTCKCSIYMLKSSIHVNNENINY